MTWRAGNIVPWNIHDIIIKHKWWWNEMKWVFGLTLPPTFHPSPSQLSCMWILCKDGRGEGCMRTKPKERKETTPGISSHLSHPIQSPPCFEEGTHSSEASEELDYLILRIGWYPSDSIIGSSSFTMHNSHVVCWLIGWVVGYEEFQAGDFTERKEWIRWKGHTKRPSFFSISLTLFVPYNTRACNAFKIAWDYFALRMLKSPSCEWAKTKIPPIK